MAAQTGKDFPVSPATAQIHTIGDNRPPIITAGQLDRDFAHLLKAVEAFAARAREVPPVIEDDADLAEVTAYVVDVRKERKRIAAIGDGESRPHLEAQRTLHAFFNAHYRELEVLQTDVEARGNRYLEKKRLAEQRRREEVERKARAEAEQARLAAFEAAKQAEAVKEQAAAGVVVHTHPAVEQQVQAALAVAAEAQVNADAAARAAAAKPVDMTRTRTTAGTASISTKIEFSFDRDKVDLEALRSYLREDELRAAINAIAIKNREAIVAGTFKLAGVNFYAKARGNYR
jgi:hypothetical protein